MAEETVPFETSGIPIRALRVEVIEGPDKGLVITTVSETLSIGTAEANDMVLNDDTVSRYHLDLQRSGDRILVRDHGSTNGTTLAGAWLHGASLAPKSTLSLGRTQIRVDDGETVTLEVYDGERLGGLIGTTPMMKQLMAMVERAAGSDTSILLLGETGTGKEVVAKAIHDASPRCKEPFETVDCGSMLPTLIASELFGHEKGAFTGADRQHTGAFERANGGTLFLDELGELPTALQTALLGALERRVIRRVGGKETVPVDVRVVCATNRDLRTEVNAGTFRQDLYYRIAVVLIRIPPLRDRVDDIPVLAEHFLRQAGHTGPIAEIIPPKAMNTLKAHRWPGNVRELRNAVEAAMVMGETPAFAEDSNASAHGNEEDGTMLIRELFNVPYHEAKAKLLDTFQDLYVKNLLERTDGNVSRAAREAQMNRSYLTKMLNKLGIKLRRVSEE